MNEFEEDKKRLLEIIDLVTNASRTEACEQRFFPIIEKKFAHEEVMSPSEREHLESCPYCLHKLADLCRKIVKEGK